MSPSREEKLKFPRVEAERSFLGIVKKRFDCYEVTRFEVRIFVSARGIIKQRRDLEEVSKVV